MINYYLKYLELLDTVFLVLKKKKLRQSHFCMFFLAISDAAIEFLHVFHHVTTAMICYIQLNGKPSIVGFVYPFVSYFVNNVLVLGCYHNKSYCSCYHV